MNKMHLSQRGQALINKQVRPDMDLFFEAFNNQYSAENPTGAFLLNVAENRLSAPLILAKISEILNNRDLPDWAQYYTFPAGHPDFLEAVSCFFETHLTKGSVDRNSLVASAGLTSVIELTATLLGDPGDKVAFPAPAYPAYEADISNKADLERVDILLPFNKKLDQDYRTKYLEPLLKENIKIIVLSSPDNPTGQTYSQDFIEKICVWCIDNEIHLVYNGIYQLSILVDDPTYAPPDFVKLMQKHYNPYLHFWYGMSKDLCASGMRVGFLYSLNQDLITAYSNVNSGCMVSNLTQWLFQSILEDKKFVSDFIFKNQRNLKSGYSKVSSVLNAHRIPFIVPQGGLFIWVDFSQFLPLADGDGFRLWEKIFRDSGLIVTPTEGFGVKEKALYRIVYSAVDPEHYEVFLNRFDRLLSDYRRELLSIEGN